MLLFFQEEKWMKVFTLHETQRIIDAIGAGNHDRNLAGPTVVRINLMDGRVIRGNYHKCEEKDLDVVNHQSDVIWDDDALRPFVERLLSSGQSFVTETGSHDTVCTLQWTIS